MLLRIAQTGQIRHELLKDELQDLRQGIEAAKLSNNLVGVLFLIVDISFYSNRMMALIIVSVLLVALLLPQTRTKSYNSRVCDHEGLK